jgi:hypothetical protein
MLVKPDIKPEQSVDLFMFSVNKAEPKKIHSAPISSSYGKSGRHDRSEIIVVFAANCFKLIKFEYNLQTWQYFHVFRIKNS